MWGFWAVTDCVCNLTVFVLRVSLTANHGMVWRGQAKKEDKDNKKSTYTCGILLVVGNKSAMIFFFNMFFEPFISKTHE